MYKDTFECFLKSSDFKRAVIQKSSEEAPAIVMGVEIYSYEWIMVQRERKNISIYLYLPVFNWEHDELGKAISQGKSRAEFFEICFEKNRLRLEQEITDDIESNPKYLT
jgi:hypothetical protein